MTFNDAVSLVLEFEGEYVDDPGDPGLATKYGISKRSYPDVDIKNLTLDQARAIYKEDFWDRCFCDELPKGLDFIMFDTAVNQGPSSAVKMLQSAAGVTVDGVLGPQTLKAAQNQGGMLTEFFARRMVQYALNPNVTRYGLGWYRRVAKAAEIAFKDAQ